MLAESAAGHGRLAALVGEAGIGKTRLMTETARLATGRGCRVLWSQMIEDPVAPPYLPWLLLLRDCLQQVDDDTLRADLGSGAADVADLVPELRDRLQLPASRPSTDSSVARYQLFDSVTRFLLAVARRQPVVLLLDNVHLADRSSLLLLEYVARQLINSPILMLMAYRGSELDDAHPLRETLTRCARLAGFEQLALSGLARGEIAELMRLVTGALVPHPILDAVSARSDGNPLFVAEVATSLARRLDDGVTTSGSDIEVPETLRAVITRRLAALDEETVEVLRTAAILGRDFDAGLLASLMERLPGDILATIERATTSGVTTQLPAGRFRFRHALFREVLYAEHRGERRSDLHRAAATHIEQRFATDLGPHWSQLAHHYFEAARVGYLPEAVAACRSAAVQALERRAYGEAAVQLEHALQVAEQAGEPDLRLRFDLQMALGDASFRAGQVHAAAWTFLRAALLAQRQEWWPELAVSVLGLQKAQGQLGLSHLASIPLHRLALEHLPADARALRAQLLGSLAIGYRHAENMPLAQSVLLEAIALAREVADPRVLFDCLSKATWTFCSTHEAPTQLALLREALALAEEAGTEQDRILAALGLPFAFSKLGEIAELETQVQRLRDLADRARDPHNRQVAAGFEVKIALLRGRWSEALQLAHASLRQASLDGTAGIEGRFAFQMFAIQRAVGGLADIAPLLARLSASMDPARVWLPGKILLHCELGQADEARLLLDRLGRVEDMPRDDLYETALVFLIEACVMLQDRERCRVLYPLLEPCRGFNVSTLGTVAYGSASGYLALLATVLRRPREARVLFEEAIEFNARLGAPPLLARTQVDFAAHLLQCPRPADRASAQQLLREARQTATRLGMRPLLQRINDLAEADPGLERLSDREVVVLRQIAAGHSNKRIAEDLHISLSTVATHIRNILRKTGARNRTEAVAHARSAKLLAGD